MGMDIEDGWRESGRCPCCCPCTSKKICLWLVISLLILLVVLLAVFLGISSYGADQFTTVSYSDCIWQDMTPANYSTLSSCATYADTSYANYFTTNYEEVQFTSREDQVQLKGWFIRGNSSFPTVIISHGFQDCRNHYSALFPAIALQKRGFNALVYSLRNHYPSQVTTARATWGVTEYLDVLGAFDFINNVFEGGKNASQIGFYGLSMGGAASYIAFGKESSVPAVFIDSGAYDVKSVVATNIEYYGIPAAPFLSASWAFINYFAGVDLDSITPANSFVNVGGRYVYLAHSSDDNMVAISNMYEAGNETEQQGGKLGEYQVATLNGGSRPPNCREHIILGAYNSTKFEEVVVGFFECAFLNGTCSFL